MTKMSKSKLDECIEALNKAKLAIDPNTPYPNPYENVFNILNDINNALNHLKELKSGIEEACKIGDGHEWFRHGDSLDKFYISQVIIEQINETKITAINDFAGVRDE